MPEYVIVNGELRHAGIKGMKWGVRRYQNKDGSLTPAGKKRYAKEEYKRADDAAFKRYEKTINSIEKNYKRGQNLSEKDLAREEAADRRYQAESAKAKAAYKQAKEQIRAEKKASKDKRTSLEKEYGNLEDQMTYGKNANAKKNATLEKQMAKLDKEMNAKKNDDSFSEAMRATAKSAGTGKRIGNLMLNGAFGGVTYTAARAAGHSKAGSEAITIVSSLMLGPVGNTAAVALMRNEYYNK